MLSALDEQLLHQIPETFDTTRCSDHRFYDRMWVNGHGICGAKFMTGIGLYKNMNVVDGFFCVIKDSRQHNVRFSRALSDNVAEIRVGPLSVEVVKPLQELAVHLETGADFNIAAELVFEGVAPAHEEAHHFARHKGRIVRDFRRYDQIGKVNGWINIGDDRLEVADWFGLRDHSWGVRPYIGGFEPHATNPFAPPVPDDAADPAVYGRLFIWLAFACPSISGQFQCFEDGTGKRIFIDGHVRYSATGEIVKVCDLEHELAFIEGSRILSGGRIKVILANGEKLDMEITAIQPPSVYKGFGYAAGFDDEQGLGVPRAKTGDLYVEHDVYELGFPDAVTMGSQFLCPQLRDNSVTLRVNGESGMGHMPTYNAGLIRKYGLVKPNVNNWEEK